MKRFQAILLAVLLPAAGGYAADALKKADFDTVVVDQSGTTLSIGEIYNHLERVPKKTLRNWIKQPEHLVRLLQNELALKRVVDEATQSGALQDPELAARLHGKMMELTARLYVDRYVEQHMTADYRLRAKEFYTVHPDRFMAPEQRTFSQLLFRLDSLGDAQASDAAEQALADLHGDAGKLESVAQAYKKDHPEFKGVEHFSGPATQFVTPFVKSAFKGEQTGLVTGVIKTQFGYHVVRIDSIQKAHPRKFSAVQDQLVKQERKKHDQELRQEYIQQKMGLDAGNVRMEALKTVIRKMLKG